MCHMQEKQLSLSSLCTYLPRHQRFTFWLTFFSKLYVTFILHWIDFIFGRDEEQDQ